MAVTTANGATPKLDAAALASTLGVSGLARYGGYVLEEPLPKGEKAWTDIFVRMQHDATMGALLAAFETLAGRVDWFWTPPDEGPEAAAVQQFIEENWEDMDRPWAEVLSEIWTMLPFGWALLEQTYKVRKGTVYRPDGTYDAVHSSRYHDGRTGWGSWALRSQETRQRWDFADDGSVKGMYQLAPPTWEERYLPMEKCLLFRTTTRKGNPEGHSLFRAPYTAYARKVRIEIIEGIGIERDLAGLPVVYVPAQLLDPNASDGDKAMARTAYNIVTNIKRDTNEGIVFPLSYDAQGKEEYRLELLSTGGSRQFDTNAIIARYKQDMLMSALADFLFIGHEARGSFALIEDKSRLFSDALESYLDKIAAVVNTYAVPRLLRLNGMDDALAPRLEHGKVREIAIDQLAAWITALVTAGLIDPTDPALRERVMQLVQLPAPPAPDATEEAEDAADADAGDAQAGGVDEGASDEVPA